MKELSGAEKLYLVGFRIDPDETCPGVYTLYVDDERPILFEDHPLLFTQPELAELALGQSDCGASSLGPAPKELYAVFDIADALYTLESREEALDGELLDCINAILDFMPFLRNPIPEQYSSALRRLADHLTFDLHFQKYLEEQSISRNTLVDAFFWSLGAIVCHAKIIGTDKRNIGDSGVSH